MTRPAAHILPPIAAKDRRLLAMLTMVVTIAILVLMAFFAALFLSQYQQREQQQNTVTLLLHPEMGSAVPSLAARQQALLDMLRESPAIANHRILSKTEMTELLTPFLGDVAGMDAGLPLPLVYELTIKDQNAAKTLATELPKAIPGLVWQDMDGSAFAEYVLVLMLAAALLAVLMLTVFVMLSLAAGQILARKFQDELALMHQWGAPEGLMIDGAIMRALGSLMAGGVLGFLVVMLMLLSAKMLLAPTAWLYLSEDHLIQIAIFLAFCFILAGIALTTILRYALRAQLTRLP